MLFFFYYFVFWLLVFCKFLEPERWFMLKWIPLSVMLIFHFHHGCWIWAEIMWYFYSYWSGLRVCPLYCNCHWPGDSSLDDSWMIVRYWRIGTWCVAAVATDVFVLWECGALVKWYWQKTKEPWEQPDVLPVHHKSCVDWLCTQMHYDYNPLCSTPRHPEVLCCEGYHSLLAWCDKNCIKMMVSMGNGWNNADRWKPKYRETDLFHCHFVHHGNTWRLTCDQT
jgi:hypothetical protein